MYKDTVNAYNKWFKSHKNVANSADNNSDVLVWGCSTSEIDQCRFSLGHKFKLHEDEVVFWIRDTSFLNSRDQGCVVSDWGISIIEDNDYPDHILQWEWNSIERVEYKNNCFYCYDVENNSTYFHIKFILKSESSYNLGEHICALFNELAKTQQRDTIAKIKKRIEELCSDGKFEKALAECDYLLTNVRDNEDKYFGLDFKQLIAYEIAKKYDPSDNSIFKNKESETQKRKAYTDIALDCLNDMQVIQPSPWVYLNKAQVLSDIVYGDNEAHQARRYAIGAMDTDDLEDKKRAIQLFKTVDGQVFSESNKFTAPDCVPFPDRQFIMFAKDAEQMAGYFDPDNNIKWVFTLNNYPSDIVIEGVPQANVLYMANPINPNTYLPYENAEEILFQSKIREFEYLVGCLGATEIKFKSIKGKKTSSEREVDRNADAEVDAKAITVKAKVNWGGSDSNQNTSISELGRTQKLKPTKYPYIPNDLGWYNYTEEWRDFARQRLENGLTHYHYTFRTSECSNLTSQKKLDVSASFKKMVLSIKAHYSQNIKESFEEQEETEWEVEVEFKPMNKFSKPSDGESGISNVFSKLFNPIKGLVINPLESLLSNDSDLTSNEKEYLKDFKVYLADGKISANDRECLEDLRKDLGITVERAKELEASLSPLKDNEQKYFDFVSKRLEDGIIDDKEREFLNRRKESLGISDSRAKEIEDMAFAKRGLK